MHSSGIETNVPNWDLTFSLSSAQQALGFWRSPKPILYFIERLDEPPIQTPYEGWFGDNCWEVLPDFLWGKESG